MPTVALNTLAKCEVQSMTWAPMQARTLTAFHAVKYDDVAALALGQQVTYTDADLGLCFAGRVVDVKKSVDEGEGVTYSCADNYRLLAKGAAYRTVLGSRTSKLKFDDGTALSSVLAKVLEGYASKFPGGITYGVTGNVAEIDKGGQTADAWISDLLGNTAGYVAYALPNGGSQRLVFTDFYSAAAVTLKVGTYNVMNIASGELPIQGGSYGKSLNKKYGKYTIEGVGRFTRRHEVYSRGEAVALVPGGNVFVMKFFVPDKKVMPKYIAGAGHCMDAFAMKVRIGGPQLSTSGPMEATIENPVVARDGATGKLYFWILVEVAGIFSTPTVPQPMAEAWVDYTAYDGPLVVSYQSTDPALVDEGELWEMDCNLIQYTDPVHGNVDNTADFLALAQDKLAKQGTADESGSIAVHVKGINAALAPGSAVTNFSNMRVRSIGYSFTDRSMTLEINSLPLRENVENARQTSTLGSLKRNDWFQRSLESGCYCEFQQLIDQDDVPVDPKPERNFEGSPGSGDGGGGDLTTWDCQFGNCVEIAGKGGTYKTEAECMRVCGAGQGVDWKPCVGCVAIEDPNAAYDDFVQCVADHPDPMEGCNYACIGPFETTPTFRCQRSPDGPYATLGQCEADCWQPGGGGPGSGGVSGSGEPSSGFESGAPFSGSGNVQPGPKAFSCPPGFCLDSVWTDGFGHVDGKTCVPCGGSGGGGSGCSGGLSISSIELCDILCEDGILTKLFTHKVYENGCLVYCNSECPDGCVGSG